jgi:hypothetical protein
LGLQGKPELFRKIFGKDLIDGYAVLPIYTNNFERVPPFKPSYIFMFLKAFIWELSPFKPLIYIYVFKGIYMGAFPFICPVFWESI